MKLLSLTRFNKNKSYVSLLSNPSLLFLFFFFLFNDSDSIVQELEKFNIRYQPRTINMRTCKWLLELKWFELNISKIWWQDKLWSWGIQMQVLLNIKTYGILLKHDLKIKTIGQKFSSKLKILKRIMQRQDAIYIA